MRVNLKLKSLKHVAFDACFQLRNGLHKYRRAFVGTFILITLAGCFYSTRTWQVEERQGPNWRNEPSSCPNWRNSLWSRIDEHRSNVLMEKYRRLYSIEKNITSCGGAFSQEFLPPITCPNVDMFDLLNEDTLLRLLQNKTVSFIGDSMNTFFYSSFAQRLKRFRVKNDSWSKSMDGGLGWNSAYTNGMKVMCRWIVGSKTNPRDNNRYWFADSFEESKMFLESDIMIVNVGAHSGQRDSLKKSMFEWASIFTKFRGIIIWKEYEAVHFPTVTGEYGKNTLKLLTKNNCLNALNDTQISQKEVWWRRDLPMKMLRKWCSASSCRLKIMKIFDLQISTGVQHPGGARGDCRHFCEESPMREIQLLALRDVLEELEKEQKL